MRISVVLGSAILIILALALLLTPSAETIPFVVKGKAGDIEFREYPPLVLAVADNSNNDAGFSLLFAYISGSNRAHTTIAMTAPVITSQKIAMTAPVFSNATSMAFVMPAGKPRNEIPDPLDNRVRIETLPGREIAVLRFSGYASADDVRAAESRLADGLKTAGVTPVGQPFLMRYNPPWIPGFLRQNEVGIEIQRQ